MGRWHRVERLLDPMDVAAGTATVFRKSGPERVATSTERAHPARVSNDTFTRVQDLLTSVTRDPGERPRTVRSSTNPYQLRGRLHCGLGRGVCKTWCPRGASELRTSQWCPRGDSLHTHTAFSHLACPRRSRSGQRTGANVGAGGHPDDFDEDLFVNRRRSPSPLERALDGGRLLDEQHLDVFSTVCVLVVGLRATGRMAGARTSSTAPTASGVGTRCPSARHRGGHHLTPGQQQARRPGGRFQRRPTQPRTWAVPGPGTFRADVSTWS
jgi:hypothetical protein